MLLCEIHMDCRSVGWLLFFSFSCYSRPWLWPWDLSLQSSGFLSRCRVRAPEHMGSVVVARGPGCPETRGILVP